MLFSAVRHEWIGGVQSSTSVPSATSSCLLTLTLPPFCAQAIVGVQLVTYPVLKKLGLASAPPAAAPAAAPFAGHGALGQSADASIAHSQEMEAFYAKQVWMWFDTFGAPPPEHNIFLELGCRQSRQFRPPRDATTTASIDKAEGLKPNTKHIAETGAREREWLVSVVL